MGSMTAAGIEARGRKGGRSGSSRRRRRSGCGGCGDGVRVEGGREGGRCLSWFA